MATHFPLSFVFDRLKTIRYSVIDRANKFKTASATVSSHGNVSLPPGNKQHEHPGDSQPDGRQQEPTGERSGPVKKDASDER